MDYRVDNLPQPDKASAPRIRYRVTPHQPHAHLFEVICTVVDPDPAGEILRLPAWIPGSYLIRDFARHIVSLAATADGKLLAARKIDQHSWQLVPPRGTRRLEVRYEVYAWDLSVRGAHLDDSHGFFNGTSLFLRVDGKAHLPCELELVRPAGSAYRDWQVATTLPPAATGRNVARPWGFGHFRADSYDALIDHPVEMGTFEKVEFEVCGVPHAVAVTGKVRCDFPRLVRDLERICAWHINFWGTPAPFDRYLFLVTAIGEGYGGLEHRDSTALLCRRQDLPSPLDPGLNDDYLTFLGLASHEYFHAWNVKRLRPADFDELDLQRPAPTELLWFFEGFTSYYDDLALVRSGLIDEERYLAGLARTINQVAATPGRAVQSVAAASFDAWTKYYRPDENTPNATVSYYTKGALVALALDLTLRTRSAGKASLDGVMRRLWHRFGNGAPGLRESDILAALREESGLAGIGRTLRDAVHGTGDLPLARLLGEIGLALAESAPAKPGLGLQLESSGEPKLKQVFADGAAMQAGLAGGDVLVAIDGLRVTAANLELLLARYRPGEAMNVHAFRRDELRSFAVTMPEDGAPRWQITAAPRARREHVSLRNQWLTGSPATRRVARPRVAT